MVECNARGKKSFVNLLKDARADFAGTRNNAKLHAISAPERSPCLYDHTTSDSYIFEVRCR
jgi:hypothetical protein